ncbi:MAG: hypothetical protein K940chlam1_00430 [Candidatus Anoxychlamydiales bacterium]|nr:hypothetical protein [Candidatus Anoxychlamydiales bacterium]NGX36284.1 hypothetical protein [Candidatus Anoxychlamydiales bacterium]
MCYMGAIGAFVGTAAMSSVSVGAIGALGLTKKVYKAIKGDKSTDSINNKIQSIVATTLLTALGIFSSTFLVGAVVINLPHLAKLLTKDPKMKERLDNIAGLAGATINALALLPLLLIAC